jgi:SAM-dependent methyltransferase
MIKNLIKILQCPRCKKNLFFKKSKSKSFNGSFYCKNNHIFFLDNSVLDFINYENKRMKIYNEIWEQESSWEKQTLIKKSEYTKTLEKKFNKFARLPGALKNYFKNKVILDAGAGTGRFSYFVLKFKPKLLVSVDFAKNSILHMKKNLKPSKNNIIIRADLNNLPFKKNQFDFIFSFGVIHHTHKPKKTFLRIVDLIRKNGFISIYIYRSGSLSFLQNLLRPITLKMNRKVIKTFCERFGFIPRKKNQIIDIKKYFKILGKFDLLGIRNISYEGLTTTYLHSYSLTETLNWFKEKNLKIISKSNIISITGKR